MTPDVHLYTHSSDDSTSGRGCSHPLDGVPEDPATGSANCALAAIAQPSQRSGDGNFRWRIAQGVEMGRPSILDARTEKQDGVVVATRIGGASVLVSEGFLEIDQLGAEEAT